MTSGGRRRIGLVTCRGLPEPDPDQELLIAALIEAGAEPGLLAWDDPEARPASFDVCVLRSCWNYMERPAAFEEWLSRAAAESSLWNPLPILRWNLRKTYLRQLERQGIPTIPTRWVERGTAVDLARVIEGTDWPEIVIKPIVSAGSYQTRRFMTSDLDEACAFLAAGVLERGWMVQCYLPMVEEHGERAIVVIDGEITHSVRKSPRFAGDAERVSDAIDPSPDERMFAGRVLDAVGESLLYGRVDVIRDGDGSPRLAELELLEPSLYLRQFPPALDRFVAAILARIPQ